MWPGEQQHGGGQNPQQPNPYQQPGYQQPNPYQQPQQPGYGYPQQGQPHSAYPAYPGQPPQGPHPPGGPGSPKGGGGKKTTTVIAVAAAVVVLAGAVVAGVVLSGDKDKGTEAGSTGKPTAGGSSPSASASAGASTAPGGGGKDPGDPVVPGWQTVINPKHYSAFDVPKNDDWTLASQGTITGYANDDKPEEVLVAMSAPAYYKDEWCKDSNRAVVGTKGGQGSRDTAEAAEIAASNFALAGYDQKQKGTLKESGAKPFQSAHGVKGHIAAVSLTGAPVDGKCDVSAAKVVAVSWINVNDDLSIWVLVTDAGVKDEVPEATIKKMTNSLRDYGEPGADADPRG